MGNILDSNAPSDTFQDILEDLKESEFPTIPGLLSLFQKRVKSISEEAPERQSTRILPLKSLDHIEDPHGLDEL